jgi:glycosyltransferase involved in cell wall biosynthesis
MRRQLGLNDCFVVGLVGSLNFAPALGTTYGWDVVEALRYTADNVIALIIGDGDGLPQLKRRATEFGVSDRCRFLGRVPTSEVRPYIAAMDVGISTQTNDLVGAVRTTAKLPLYLSCGCPVLASDVGEARRLLGPLGWTIKYSGVVDRTYPRRLADVITEWTSDAGSKMRREQALSLAARAFDVDEIRHRVNGIVDALLD